MFAWNNAWRSVTRNKGRNVLIVIIVAIIAAAATIGLSIRQAAQTARDTGLSNTTVTAQISVDRSKLISDSRSESSDSGTPDFDSMREALSDKELSLSDYEKYAEASSSVQSTYYSETTSLAATDSFQPVEDSTSSSQSSSDSSSSESNAEGGQGAPQGGDGGGMQQMSGDFQLTGFSSDTAVANASNGSFTMVDGSVFGYDESSNGQVIISKALADFNNLSVGSTITVADASDSSTTYTLTVVGIYENTTDSSSQGGPMGSSASDPDNAIYTSVSTLKSLGLDSDSDSDSAAQLSFTYVFANKDAYETFVTDVKAAGLSDDYTVSSADVDEYESSLVPLNNLSQFALTLLLIVLGVGAIVLIAINVFNVRERKYEVGVLTAMGVKKVTVAAQFVFELFMVTLIGLAIGVAAGAATSVPVSNQLLASQVAAQESEQSSQQAQFGREMQGGPGAQTSSDTSSDSDSSSSDSSSSSSESSQSTSNDSSSTAAQTPSAPGNSPFGQATNYLSEVNATVNLSVVGQLVLIGIALTLFSSLAAVIFVMRYEPLQILADRS